MQIGTVQVSLPAGQCPCHNLEEVQLASTKTLVQEGWIPTGSATSITAEGVGNFRLATIEGEFVIEFEEFGFETGGRTIYMFSLNDTPTEMTTTN